MSYIIIGIFVVLLLIAFVLFLNFKKICKLFDRGNVITTGLRGTGKDMLSANVVARKCRPYISNIDYHCRKSVFIPINFDALDCKNNYKNLISGDIVPYDYPYPEHCDIFISDAGVYFPSQYQDKLVREYDKMPVFQALSRHLGDCNFHCNVQNLNRLWDKIREQSDIYIRCISCKCIGKIVVQKVIVYDKYESCLNRVSPYVHVKAPLIGHRAEYKSRDDIAYREFVERNGSVKSYLCLYLNKSKYDTRLFKKLLRGDSM